MFKFSPRSLENRAQLHPDLQRLVDHAIHYIDFSIEEGYRPLELQEEYFKAGSTRVKVGKHNTRPSEAVHLVPYPRPRPPASSVDDAGIAREWREYAFFAGAILAFAIELEIPLIWGGDWNHDWRTVDNTFNDLQHYELRLKRPSGGI